MALKKLWLRTSNLFSGRRSRGDANSSPEDDEPQNSGENKTSSDISVAEKNYTNPDKASVKTVPLRPEADSITKQQESYNKLVDKLHGINESLHHQLVLHEELINKIDKLPGLFENIPTMLENQQRLNEQLLKQLADNSVNNKHFQEIVEKIPLQTAKQTNALTEMNQHLRSSSENDKKLVNNFNRFNETLVDLNKSNQSHKDSILQMSKTFATSDRYLKYLMTKQNKRFVWVFLISMVICSASIVALVSMVIYLLKN